jgi:DNA-binding NarL/FixJ family response regulator
MLVSGKHIGYTALQSALVDDPAYRIDVTVPQGEAISVAKRQRPDIILFCADVLGDAGVDRLRNLHGSSPSSKIIVFCDGVGEGMLLELRRVPVGGHFVWNDVRPATLRAALVMVAEGMWAGSLASREELSRWRTTATEPSSVHLTESEQTVVWGLDRGLSEKKIGELTEKEMEGHRTIAERSMSRAVLTLKKKLGVRTLYWLGRMVERLGLSKTNRP